MAASDITVSGLNKVGAEDAAYLVSKIRTIPGFPKEGILFRDFMPVLADARAFPSIRNTRRSSLIPKDRNCVSASTPSAVNMSVRHTCMMMRSMRTAIRYPRKTSPTRSLSSTRLKSPHRMPMLFSSPLTSRRTIDFFDF